MAIWPPFISIKSHQLDAVSSSKAGAGSTYVRAIRIGHASMGLSMATASFETVRGITSRARIVASLSLMLAKSRCASIGGIAGQ